MKRIALGAATALLIIPYYWILWRAYGPSIFDAIIMALSFALYLPVWYAIIRYGENPKVQWLAGACLLAPVIIRLFYSLALAWSIPCTTNVGCRYLDIFYLSMMYGMLIYIGYRIKNNMI
ncbi:MAG: hypothetical protein ACOY0R_03095 [Chloroflexota bacterium]